LHCNDPPVWYVFELKPELKKGGTMNQTPRIASKSSLQAPQVLSGLLIGALVLSAGYMFFQLLTR